MSQLEALFTKYGTDKGIWGYTPAYEKHLAPLQESAKNVLEIGICGYRDIPNNVVGASLFAWRDYFPNAHINGVDNDGRFIFNDHQRISTYLCDAYDPVAMIKNVIGPILNGERRGLFDFICDDAVHDPLPQLYLFKTLWPFVKKGGVYAVEEACPYKCLGNNLEMVGQLMFAMYDDVQVTEYQTHKDERLLILTKA